MEFRITSSYTIWLESNVWSFKTIVSVICEHMFVVDFAHSSIIIAATDILSADWLDNKVSTEESKMERAEEFAADKESRVNTLAIAVHPANRVSTTAASFSAASMEKSMDEM